MVIYIIFTFAAGCAYLILILLFTWGWKKTKTPDISIPRKKTIVSVIIAVRDEEINIPSLTSALSYQDYPDELMEVLFVNDYSTDATIESIKLCMTGNKRFTILNNKGIGKKEALLTGFAEATGDLIITTDADCTFGPRWITSIVSFYEEKNATFIIGPVVLEEGPGIFQDLQALEFLSLTGTAGGSAGIQRPVLCNGANLAFVREVVNSPQPDTGIQFASGDDIFLLHRHKRSAIQDLRFLKSREAAVSSKTHSEIRSFWAQRKRWISKSPGYRDSDTIITSLVVYFMNLFLLLSAILTTVDVTFALIFIGLLVFKSIPDFLFIYSVTSFFHKRHLIRYFLILQFIYFFYVSIIPFSGIWGRYTWKNRHYSMGNKSSKEDIG